MSILSVHFGPFSLSFASPSSNIDEYLRNFFSGYECDRSPDFLVTIRLSDELPPPVVQPRQRWLSLALNKKGFEIGPDLIRGSTNSRHDECTIQVHENFFQLPLLEVFQGFLFRLYYTICMARSVQSCFVHGCGVIKEKTGYLFIGGHQAGKTTIGKSSGGLVIHDDQIIVSFDETGCSMDSPPLPGKLRHHPDRAVLIDRMYLIVQDTQVSVKQLQPALALKSLYAEIVSPLTLFSNDEINARILKAKSCFEILNRLPVFELHFDKKGYFWDSLAQLQPSGGGWSGGI